MFRIEYNGAVLWTRVYSPGGGKIQFGDSDVGTINFCGNVNFGTSFPNKNCTVDFTKATIKGVGFSQVSRLTADHTEFYCYIVFGGIGIYTPVMAATLGRTYTTAAATDNGEYPIYGIIINISTSGTVSVSKIYGVYPYSKHQSGIDFTASSVTIYAR